MSTFLGLITGSKELEILFDHYLVFNLKIFLECCTNLGPTLGFRFVTRCKEFKTFSDLKATTSSP